MSFLWTDLRYAWRSARRSPGVTLAIVAMLALGTGGATAVFTPIYSQIFVSLPFPQPEQLVIIGGDIPLFTGSMFDRGEELGRIFSNLTTYAPYPASRVAIPDTGKTTEVLAMNVTEDFFETLGVRPLRGYDFKHDEAAFTAAVSNRFWRDEMMRTEDAIGKRIQVNGNWYAIVSIMPETFDFPSGADIWTNIRASAFSNSARQYLGRLRPGMSMARAAEELKALGFKPRPGLQGNAGPVLQPLETVLYSDRRPMLWMLGSAAVLFLLLMCAGVANLLVTRGARRKSEMAMRLILGASRRSLVLQLLRETLPLVVAGAVAGLWLSEIAGAWLLARFPALKGVEVADPVKMAFFAALVFAMTIISGLTPALYASGVDLNTYLKSGSNFKRRLFSFSLQELLTGVQLGLALALLTGIGLLVSSLMFNIYVPVGWLSRDATAVVRAEFPTSMTQGIPSKEDMTRYAMFFQDFQQRLGAMSEVAAAGIFNPIPFSDVAVRASQIPVGVSKNRPGEPENVFFPTLEGFVNPEGFKVFGIPLVAGRSFSSADMADEVDYRIKWWSEMRGTETNNGVGGVVLVNQSLARQLWPEESAVGKTIYNYNRNVSYQIIGVVRDFHQVGNRKDFAPAVYYPPDSYRQHQTFLVKLHSKSLMKDFRQRLSGLDTGSARIEVRPLDEVLSGAISNIRLTLQLLGCFAILGIVVSGLSIYATTTLMAAARNREMGVRMALGAQTWAIFRLALWRGTRAILLGLPLGLFLAWILSKVLSSFLFQVKTDEPLAWAASCVVLLGIMIVAALIPALRSIRANPLDILRNE